MTKSQVDKLGERLKSGNYGDDDLRLLDEYRQSFDRVGQYIVSLLRTKLDLEPTNRPAKTTDSIVAKLQRQSIRLSRIQDIGGCRVIVDGVLKQNTLVEELRNSFDDLRISDRRMQPSHGYRAVHVVVKYDSKLFEIQIRTILQDLWAEFSERISDTIDPRIKYGIGPDYYLDYLSKISVLVARHEALELDQRIQLLNLEVDLAKAKLELIELLTQMITT